MSRFRVVLYVDWDDPHSVSDDVSTWLMRSLDIDAPGTPDYVEIDELEDMGT